ncbi:MAG: MotA/TolQ/ExbB proton channel family protein [Alphaproteobacteria bacterium]|nr:MotA/TolQ/ExbB proton channel family protein [Alphaproteobacteria bacterium]
MSYSTLLGFFGGVGLFVGAILLTTEYYMSFIDTPSFLMVIGGTLASTFIGFEPRYVAKAIRKGLSIIFSHKETSLTDEVGRIIRWGYIVQKNGLQGLESDAEGIIGEDKILTFGVDLVITGYTGDEVREILTKTIQTTFKRAKDKSIILNYMGGTAPAFGMIGTLVGLIIMLQAMGSDPSSIGPAMAVALVTTLYGVIFARLIFIPAASRVVQRDDLLRFRSYLIAEGLALLAERKSPRYIQDRMNSFLDPLEHYSIDRDMTQTAE